MVVVVTALVSTGGKGVALTVAFLSNKEQLPFPFTRLIRGKLEFRFYIVSNNSAFG